MTGARTASDIERKYNFDKSFAEVMGLATDAQQIAEEAKEAASNLDSNLTSDEIFNRLTRNGQLQGLFKGVDGEIYINAKFVKSAEMVLENSAFLNPENEEIETVRQHLLGNITISDDLIPYYDTNNDGKISLSDLSNLRLASLGQIDLAKNMNGAKKSDITLSFDLSNPERFLTLKGKNMWGREIEKYIGVNGTNIKNLEAVDYIVESGTRDNWTYEKWASGKAVCWSEYDFGEVTCVNPYGNWYASSVIDYYFPAGLFNKKPTHIEKTVEDTGGTSCYITNADAPDSNSVGTFQLTGPLPVTFTRALISFCAVGTWQ